MKNIINIQVYPSKKRIVPNCKLAKIINNLTDSQFDNMTDKGKKRGLIEMKNHKKFGEILSSYKIVNGNDYDGTDPLTEFDRAVLSVCASEWEIGNRHTSPAIILRGLTGKISTGGNGKIHSDQRAAILYSIKKMMGLILEIDMSETNQKLKYNDGLEQKLTSAILPAYFVTDSINGQPIEDVIYFDRESPVMKISRDRKQLLTFDMALLDVPKQQNTQMNITAKNYVMCRIQEIKLHRLTPTITFADIFEKCRIENAANDKKADVRNSIIKFLEHLKSQGEIRDFELTKKAQSFYSIKFSYKSKHTPRKPKTIIENDNASATSKPLADATL